MWTNGPEIEFWAFWEVRWKTVRHKDERTCVDVTLSQQFGPASRAETIKLGTLRKPVGAVEAFPGGLEV